MQIDTYGMSHGDLLQTANGLKDLLFRQLERDGHIADSRKLSESYGVVLVRRGWFGVFFDKLRGLTDDTLRFEVVRIINDEQVEDSLSESKPQTENA